jgi:hypothetical protein
VRWATAPGVVAAAAGVTAALGGFRAAEPPPAPQVAAEQVIDQGLFRTQVQRAYVGRRGDLISDDTKRWLTVEFRVVNTSDDTRDPAEFAADPYRQLITVVLPGGRVDPLKHVDRVDRGSWKSQQVPPRTPVRLIVAWYDWVGPVPDRVTVSLPTFERRAPVFFDMPATWQTKVTANKTLDTRDDPAVVAARVTVPVVRKDFP